MAATLVYLLREIYEGVEQSAHAWEKRDYWMKAERFLRDWQWTKETAVNIEDVIRNDAWDLLPEAAGGAAPPICGYKNQNDDAPIRFMARQLPPSDGRRTQ
ncbi:MAG: hypothetical protein M5U34_24895 [Chloroflexi bacterium]|nr:hypothetical protein [Chloroflexota bacterium]